jgi:hypothetical protein
VSLASPGAVYSQDFDTLSNTAGSTTNALTITGWYLAESGSSTRNNGQYAVDTGAGNSGDTISYGSAGSTDRALGGLRSGTLVPTIGACFTNNTGAAITSVGISYVGEHWRIGVATRGAADRLDFQYSTDATSLTTGTWANVDALDYHSTVTSGALGALDGNNAANRTAISSSITGLSIPNGATLWIRWTDFDIASSDDGLAVDDFSLKLPGAVINEFVANHTGVDTNEYVEIFGPPSTNLSNLTILQIEGDFSGTATGVIDSAITVGTTDANGYWWTGYLNNVLENGTLTLLLVEGFSGAVGNDLDTNDDGVLDATPWTRIVDAVAVTDGGASDRTYGVPVLGTAFGGGFTPGGASRLPNGVDTDSIADWTLNDFDGAGIPGFTGTPVFGEAFNTPGATNQAVPAELAPSVASTVPANGATGVSTSATLTVTFSEAVDVTAGAFALECPVATPVAFTVSPVLPATGATVFTLTPSAALPAATTCTATVFAANVTDTDLVDPPDNMAADYVWTFTTGAAPIRIHTIQGNGTASPLVGQVVTTTGIVTGRKFNNGFFIQTPDAEVDADPATSEGIFVFTSSAPPADAAVGNLVEVTGTVVEYVPTADPYQPPLTELSFPTVSLISTGNPLPAPVVLTSTNPDPAGPYDQLERYEGMRVSVPSMTVVGGTLGNISEANATATSNGVFYGVVTGVARPFREAGIRPPDPAPEGTIPPIPRWDGNPEMLRVDTDGQIGATSFNVGAGAVVTNVVGPLDYTFRYYTVHPDPATPPVPTGGPAGVAVATPLASEFTVASYNLQRFFDTVNDPAIGEPVLTPTAFDNRLAKASLGIRNFLKTPDVLGVVEVENLSTLQALATRINNDAVAASQPDPGYFAYLVEGLDVGGIDVGFLVKTAEVAAGTPRVEVVQVVQELAGSLLVNPDASTSVLNDRPPLRLNAIVHHPNGATFPVTVIVNHLRSLNGVDDPAPGSNGWATSGARVRAKRLAQAADLANLVQTRQATDPAERIILVGDFNAFEVNDGLVHSMATIAGTPVPDDQTAVPGDGTDLVNPDLVNLVSLVPAAERYGYVFDGSAQNLDHALVNAAVVTSTLARRIEHPRINADFPLTAMNDTATAFRLSDHDPVVGFFQVAAFASAGITTTMTDAPDPVYPGAGLTYTITVANGGPDAATGLTLTDALPAGTLFASLTAPGGWACTTPAVGANGTVTCTAPTLAALSSAIFTLSVTVDPAVAPGTVLTNTASVTQTSSEATPGDESATATTTVQTPPDVYATKSVSGVAFPGATLTYTLVLYNNGTTPQLDNPGDELVDVLPSSLVLVSASATSGAAVATVATNTVTWNGSIPAGGSVTVTIVATVGSGAAIGQVISNQGTVYFDADGNGTNESSTVTDDPATGTVGDATAITVTLGPGGVAVVPAAGTVGLGLLAFLVALGGALLVGRRLA